MAKHLSLNGHYMPILEKEFLDGPDQASLSSDSSGSFLDPHSESTLGQQSTKQGTKHSTASTLVLQMEHEREQGNLSRCLSLAREREELERELRKYTVDQNPYSLEQTDDEYERIWKIRETSTPQGNYQVIRQSLLSENTSMLKGRAASCIPWEENTGCLLQAWCPYIPLMERIPSIGRINKVTIPSTDPTIKGLVV